MNCQDFETTFVEIARHCLTDASVLERGLKHAEACQSCAALLAEEHALSERLKALSIQAAAEPVPHGIEDAVMSAFRQHKAISTGAKMSSPASIRQRSLLAAAAVLLITALSLAVWLASKQKHDPIAIYPEPKPFELPRSNELEDFRTASQTKEQNFALTIRDPKPVRRRKRILTESAYPQPAPSNSRSEFVTQFYPINQASELIPLEGGQILRVRMPRTNLAPLGIPFNQDRADETVMADVLVSNDGLARAIRLVY